MIPEHGTNYHLPPKKISDQLIRFLVKFLRFFADLFFKDRYAHRAVFIETIAAIPGMVGGAFLHFKCLRKIKDDEGWIQTLLDEAENERMHLMAFIQIAKPSWLERILIYFAQFGFGFFYTTLYLCSSGLAHRFVGYLEEEAVQSYTDYITHIDNGTIKNGPAPEMGIHYWKLKKNATLRDLIIAIRKDECHHRDVNHHLSNLIRGEKFKV